MTDPKLANTSSNGDRTYQHARTHEVVPSVTTVIKNGIPKPALMPWAAKMAAEHADANWYRLSKLPPTERVNEIKGAYKVYTEKAANLGARALVVTASAASRERPGLPLNSNKNGPWIFSM